MMAETPAEQFDALSKAATQGNWCRSGMRSKRLGEDCTVISCDDKAMLYSPIGRTHAELAASINEADFIAFCFNNRAIISAALRSVENDGWMPIETAPKDGQAIILTGVYPNGVRWVEEGLWQNHRKKFSGPIEGPTAWQPLPLPPTPGATGE